MTIHSPRQSGVSLIKFLISIVVLAALAYVSWVTYSHWNRTGNLDMGAVADRDARDAAHADARPHVDWAVGIVGDAAATVKQFASEAFSEGGLVDEAADWLRSARSPAGQPAQGPVATAIAEEEKAAAAPVTPAPTATSAPTTTPAPPAAPQKSSETRRIESAIAQAETTFAQALGRYEAANPANGGWTPERKRAVKDAAAGFAKVRDLLMENLDTYERQSDHSPTILSKGRQLQQHNQRLLFNANKMSPAL